jgi:N-acetylmuramoyl-L-alanine amidase
MHPAVRRDLLGLLLPLLLSACSHPSAGGAPEPVSEHGAWPPIPLAHGPLHLKVVYPDSAARIEVEDSSFVFGSLGDGAASLTIDGAPVPVAPNGGWLAWIPFRGDSVITLRIVARTATDSVHLDYHLHRAPRFVPPQGDKPWVDTTAFRPSGRVWWPASEYLPLSVRASEAAAVTLILPDGARVPLASERGQRYRGALRGGRIGDPGPLLPAGTAAASGPEAVLEVVKGSDSIRVRWPLRLAVIDSLPVTVELDDDPSHRGGTDGITVGRAAPASTYTWFFPTGTRARATARIDADIRLALSTRSDAWVAAAEAARVEGAPIGPRVVGSVALSQRSGSVVVRIPLGSRIPFQVLEEERALTLLLYGAVSDVNWLRYGPEESLVTLATTRQVSADELELRFDLSEPVWGYRTRWDGTDLMLELRRPPAIDRSSPLRGRVIAVDPGHPPAGATGPTGLTEAEANLGIALEVKRLLEAAGVVVVMTRSDSRPVELWPRTRFADSADAELLISIHNNALPDGVNPFTSNGSSTFYNHPRSLPLARAILRRLVARFGLRDLGVGRGDLALVRPTWMPAVLTEGLFMMLPEQEAVLRSPQGQRRYALAVVEGLRQFLSDRAAGRW